MAWTWKHDTVDKHLNTNCTLQYVWNLEGHSVLLHALHHLEDQLHQQVLGVILVCDEAEYSALYIF